MSKDNVAVRSVHHEGDRLLVVTADGGRFEITDSTVAEAKGREEAQKERRALCETIRLEAIATLRRLLIGSDAEQARLAAIDLIALSQGGLS